MVTRKLRFISRQSALAQIQVKEAMDLLVPLLPEGTQLETAILTTPGDRDLVTPLTDPDVPDDFFTRDLDDALINAEADIAVHSAKDLPETMRDELTLAALLPSKDIRDALVFRKDFNPDDAPNSVATSSPRREDLIRALYPDIEMRPVRGNVAERLEQLDRGDFDAVIIAACALERLGLSARIGKYLPYDPAPQQGRLALTVRADDEELTALLRQIDVRRTAGLVALVGCPAEAALLSYRAGQYVNHADVVLHDRLIPESVLETLGTRAVCVGKRFGQESTPQSEIHRMMLEEAEKGRLVVRLKGGDPGVFGHLGEELEFLTSWGLRTDIVPAVTAAQITASRASVSLTHRGGGKTITLMSAHPSDQPFMHGFPDPKDGNIAVYMGVTQLPELVQHLKSAGWPDDASFIASEMIGKDDEALHVSTLGECGNLDLKPPALFLVGNRPFPQPVRTLFVGTDPEPFLRHGPLLHWPFIRLQVLPLDERKASVEEHLPEVAGVIFPSRIAVKAFIEAVLAWKDVRALTGKKMLAVGPVTEAELASHGIRADAAADSFHGVQALAEKTREDFKGRYLYPCSDAAPQADRIKSLKQSGIELIPVVYYRNEPVQHHHLPHLSFQRVLFTSGSTVKAYFDQFPEELKAHRTWLAVGPATLKELEALDLKAGIIQEWPAKCAKFREK
ncbi:MAG: hydroxymethylbilane synthase [Verrucomicrobia bacterium]|nr:hydroxymethylbilane synthase [Verrucomicrobiota bacterium]